MFQRPVKAGITVVLAIASSGCAFDLVRVKQTPAELEQAYTVRQPWLLKNEVAVGIGTGYRTRLNSGTRWEYVGTIQQGDVYKTRDQIVTVVGPNIFEAEVVVSQGNLVGFYLPVERAFTPASDALVLEMEALETLE